MRCFPTPSASAAPTSAWSSPGTSPPELRRACAARARSASLGADQLAQVDHGGRDCGPRLPDPARARLGFDLGLVRARRQIFEVELAPRAEGRRRVLARTEDLGRAEGGHHAPAVRARDGHPAADHAQRAYVEADERAAAERGGDEPLGVSHLMIERDVRALDRDAGRVIGKQRGNEEQAARVGAADLLAVEVTAHAREAVDVDERVAVLDGARGEDPSAYRGEPAGAGRGGDGGGARALDAGLIAAVRTLVLQLRQRRVAEEAPLGANAVAGALAERESPLRLDAAAGHAGRAAREGSGGPALPESPAQDGPETGRGPRAAPA